MFGDFSESACSSTTQFQEGSTIFWKAHLTSITARTTLAEVFNRVRKISGIFSLFPPLVLSFEGETVVDPKTVAELFTEHFASVSRKDPAAPGTRQRRNLQSLASSGGESYIIFSLSELKMILSQCHDSSPGPDDIPYGSLRHMSDCVFTFLLDLYN